MTNPDIAYRRLAYALRNPMERMLLLRPPRRQRLWHVSEATLASANGNSGPHKR